jgi:hypothetical protein
MNIGGLLHLIRHGAHPRLLWTASRQPRRRDHDKGSTNVRSDAHRHTPRCCCVSAAAHPYQARWVFVFPVFRNVSAPSRGEASIRPGV